MFRIGWIARQWWLDIDRSNALGFIRGAFGMLREQLVQNRLLGYANRHPDDIGAVASRDAVLRVVDGGRMLLDVLAAEHGFPPYVGRITTLNVNRWLRKLQNYLELKEAIAASF